MGKTIRVTRDPRGGVTMTPKQVRQAKRALKQQRDRRTSRVDYAALMTDVPRKGKRTHALAVTARAGNGGAPGSSQWAHSPYGAVTPTMRDVRWSA